MKLVQYGWIVLLFPLFVFAASTGLEPDGAGKVVLNGTLDGNSNDAVGFDSVGVTNNTSTDTLTIRGGSPTNGAVLIATNTSGQSVWQHFPKFWYGATTLQTFTNSVDVPVYFATQYGLAGGAFDGTNWTPGAVVWCDVTVSMIMANSGTAAAGFGYFSLYKNGAALSIGPLVYFDGSNPSAAATFKFQNEVATNRYYFTFQHQYSGINNVTNLADGTRCFVTGVSYP